jgi:type I restriction enzyme S subunit
MTQSNDLNILNIPSIRFPGFTNEWENTKFSSFLKERSEFPDKDYPLYSLTIEKGVTPKTERYERSFLIATEKDAYKVMHEHDFAYNPMNLRFGALARHVGKTKVVVSKYYNIFYCNSNVNPIFIEKYLTRNKMIHYYNRMATGSLVEKRRVHYLDFIKFIKSLPSLQEQNQIAVFMLNVDNWITILNNEIQSLELYKKSLVQSIFSQKIRFKDHDNKEYPEWKIVKVNNLIEEVNERTTENNKYPILSSSMSGIYLQSEYFKKQTASTDTTGYKIVKKGNFTYRSMSDTGEFTFNIQNLVDKGIVSPAYPVFRVMGIAVNPNFLHLFLNKSEYAKRQIIKLKEGGTRYALSFNKFKQILCPIPDMNEQNEITTFILLLNNLISLNE